MLLNQIGGLILLIRSLRVFFLFSISLFMIFIQTGDTKTIFTEYSLRDIKNDNSWEESFHFYSEHPEYEHHKATFLQTFTQ